MEKHFIIELDFFNPSIEDAYAYERKQNKIIELFKKTNRVLSISVSGDEAVMWVVMVSESEDELQSYLATMEFPDFTGYEYYELNLHVSINSFESYSLN